MSWVVYVAAWRVGEMRTVVLCGNVRDRDHFEDLGVDGRILIGSESNRMGGCGLSKEKRRVFVNVVMELYGANALTS